MNSRCPREEAKGITPLEPVEEGMIIFGLVPHLQVSFLKCVAQQFMDSVCDGKDTGSNPKVDRVMSPFGS